MASTKAPKPITFVKPNADQLLQREKQLALGKATAEYAEYLRVKPLRSDRSDDDPRTPKTSHKCSKRSWTGQIRKWRRELHRYDPDGYFPHPQHMNPSET